MTDKLQETLQAFDYELADHYIVAEEGIYSFTKDDSFFNSCNSEYEKSIHGGRIKRSNEWDLDI